MGAYFRQGSNGKGSKIQLQEFHRLNARDSFLLRYPLISSVRRVTQDYDFFNILFIGIVGIYFSEKFLLINWNFGKLINKLYIVCPT